MPAIPRPGDENPPACKKNHEFLHVPLSCVGYAYHNSGFTPDDCTTDEEWEVVEEEATHALKQEPAAIKVDAQKTFGTKDDCHIPPNPHGNSKLAFGEQANYHADGTGHHPEPSELAETVKLAKSLERIATQDAEAEFRAERDSNLLAPATIKAELRRANQFLRGALEQAALILRAPTSSGVPSTCVKRSADALEGAIKAAEPALRRLRSSYQ